MARYLLISESDLEMILMILGSAVGVVYRQSMVRMNNHTSTTV